MLSAKTITDEHLRKLRAWLFARRGGDALELRALVAINNALGRSHRRDKARAHCAALINSLGTWVQRPTGKVLHVRSRRSA